jgi:response regulator of citrate/malate metabolism
MSLHSELVILDLDLLGEQVTHLMNVLRNIKKNVQFILILSTDKMPICPEAISLGVISYILKPCSAKNLGNLIQSTLNKLKVHN